MEKNAQSEKNERKRPREEDPEGQVLEQGRKLKKHRELKRDKRRRSALQHQNQLQKQQQNLEGPLTFDEIMATFPLKLQEAITRFIEASKVEITKLKSKGLGPEQAIQLLIATIKEGQAQNAEAKQEDVDFVKQKLAGATEQEAERVVLLKDELPKLRLAGKRAPDAVDELAHRMQRLSSSLPSSPPQSTSSSSTTTAHNDSPMSTKKRGGNTSSFDVEGSSAKRNRISTEEPSSPTSFSPRHPSTSSTFATRTNPFSFPLNSSSTSEKNAPYIEEEGRSEKGMPRYNANYNNDDESSVESEENTNSNAASPSRSTKVNPKKRKEVDAYSLDETLRRKRSKMIEEQPHSDANGEESPT